MNEDMINTAAGLYRMAADVMNAANSKEKFERFEPMLEGVEAELLRYKQRLEKLGYNPEAPTEDEVVGAWAAIAPRIAEVRQDFEQAKAIFEGMRQPVRH